MSTFLSLALGACAALGAPADDPLASTERRLQQMYERLAPSVVLIGGKGSLASGFFVSADGVVLTNAHAVGQADTVEVVLLDGRHLTGTVVERAREDVDLALVHVPIANAPVPPLAAEDELEIGSFVAAVGHGRGAVWTFNVGMVSNVYPLGEERPVIQTQIPLNPGNSGGPLVDRRGRVVGVVTSGLSESNSINFAIRIGFACGSLRGLRPHCSCLVVDAPKGVAVFVDGRMRGTGPDLAVPVSPGTHEVFAVIGGVKVSRTVTYPGQREVRLDVAPR